MLLIDADNVSADVIEQAVEKVRAEHGAIHVRRAYCTAESALANIRLFKACSIRPIVNLSTGKNSTDIALAVDALDLVLAERPDVVVIVSSDSDFAPLVIRLREKGCRVEGIGQLGKTGEESKNVYDAFVDIAHRKARTVDSAPPPRKRAPNARAAADADTSAPAPAPARKTRQSKASQKVQQPVPAQPQPAAAVPPQRAKPVMPDDLRRILAVLPELARGARMELGVAAERLRSENLLAKNAPSTRLFKKYPDWFGLSPETQPNKVHYLGLSGD
jgi:uncharacterized protein (TIGR00288 family)